MDTAQRILAAADEILGEVGYEGMSIGDVAARAGVNKALVFYHHGSKPELLQRVLEGYYAAHAAALESAFEKGGTLRERLHHVVDAYVSFIAKNARYPRLVQQLVAGSSENLPLIQDNLGMLFDWTTHALAELTPDEGPLAARHFFLTFSAMVLNSFTYAPALAPRWGSDPLSAGGISERTAHLHWMVDAVLDALEREKKARLAPKKKR